MTRHVLFCTIVLLGLIQTARASDDSVDARALLARMSQAMQTLNYRGVFVYLHDHQVEAMEIVHARNADGEHERLISLVGVPREILRTNDVLTCVLPDARAVVVEKSRPRQYLPVGLLKFSDALSQHYEFKLLGSDRMTGRQAHVVAVLPKDRYRYGYRLWIDHDTALLLKSDLVNDKGMAIEQVMFTSLEVSSDIQAPVLNRSALDKHGYQWFHGQRRAELHSQKHPSQWQVTRLPEGFKMRMHSEHPLPTGRMPVEHMVFSDGLSSVSVYIEKPDQAMELLKGGSSMGAVNVYGTMVGGHQITVVGEVPRAAVEMIGESVRYTPASTTEP